MSTPTALPKTKRGVERRAQILSAAETVIGEKGFTAASIADITREAGTAQGTFYIYFASKEEIFRELVLEMGRITRTIVTRAVSEASDRLQAEQDGLRAFLRFVAKRPSLYQIVEEARFVDPDAYRAYFTSFAKAYESQLAAAAAAGELRPGDAEIRAWALMGMAKTLGERFVIWEAEPDIDRVVDEAFALIRTGLEP
ncbi:TetR/AcrR family transcriptional regulator [Actibacterium sp. XHP0104]|uniref:TetR/AcrR family transcriptional regulator n=1 Tax=Actibacterium sp. XHP0104 TaxID=2984335 RepID=UPI0021E7CA88|nr:TetR/AcrR family transcriptional regulator [Actibacterium sp. XHP0104]MCV2882529.1 TetR/AcrR family transcriptional regulator [Actibacterium sp. XHP0104]